MTDSQTSHRWLLAPLLGNPDGYIFEKSKRGQPITNAAFELLNKYNDIMPKVGSINVLHDLHKDAVASISYHREGDGWAFAITSISDDLPL